MGLGTINGRALKWPRQISRRRVAKQDWDLPTHNNGSPGKRISMISSVWDSPSSKRRGERSTKSQRPAPLATIRRILSRSAGGHAGGTGGKGTSIGKSAAWGNFSGWSGYQAQTRALRIWLMISRSGTGRPHPATLALSKSKISCSGMWAIKCRAQRNIKKWTPLPADGHESSIASGHRGKLLSAGLLFLGSLRKRSGAGATENGGTVSIGYSPLCRDRV